MDTQTAFNPADLTATGLITSVDEAAEALDREYLTRRDKLNQIRAQVAGKIREVAELDDARIARENEEARLAAVRATFETTLLEVQGELDKLIGKDMTKFNTAFTKWAAELPDFIAQQRGLTQRLYALIGKAAYAAGAAAETITEKEFYRISADLAGRAVSAPLVPTALPAAALPALGLTASNEQTRGAAARTVIQNRSRAGMKGLE